MDPVTDVDIASIRVRAREWLADADLPQLSEDFEERFRVLRHWHHTLFDAGLVGLSWPTHLGGQGLSAAHQLAVTEELVKAGAPQPVGAIGLDVVGPSIVKYGTPEQHQRFVRPILSGAEVWCQGFSEPEAGSDLGSLRTRGSVTNDEIVINGQKVWTSWAMQAQWCAVLVRTDPAAAKHRGISYVLVELTSPGITVRPIVQITGDAEFCEVFFDDVRVPRNQVLGELNGGWEILLDTLSHERSSYAIRRRLELQLVFSALVADMRARRTTADATAHRKLGGAYAAMCGLGSLTRETAARLTEGHGPSALDSVDKLVLAATEQKLCGAALDLMGPYRMAASGNPHSAEAERRIKDYLYGRSASVYGGSAQIQRSIIAERLLKLPRGAR